MAVITCVTTNTDLPLSLISQVHLRGALGEAIIYYSCPTIQTISLTASFSVIVIFVTLRLVYCLRRNQFAFVMDTTEDFSPYRSDGKLASPLDYMLQVSEGF